MSRTGLKTRLTTITLNIDENYHKCPGRHLVIFHELDDKDQLTANRWMGYVTDSILFEALKPYLKHQLGGLPFSEPRTILLDGDNRG